MALDNDALPADTLTALMEASAAINGSLDLRTTLKHIAEKALIIKAMKDHAWNQTRAAKTLGISRDNLRYRIKKYTIDKPA